MSSRGGVQFELTGLFLGTSTALHCPRMINGMSFEYIALYCVQTCLCVCLFLLDKKFR